MEGIVVLLLRYYIRLLYSVSLCLTVAVVGRIIVYKIVYSIIKLDLLIIQMMS